MTFSRAIRAGRCDLMRGVVQDAGASERQRDSVVSTLTYWIIEPEGRSW